MVRRVLALVAVAAGVTAAAADVYYTEEVVNPGFGAQKLGARRTRSEVFVKGPRQKVVATIFAADRTAQALRDQGQPLKSSTIVRLDDRQVYEINLENQTYVQKTAPPPDSGATAARAAKTAGGPRISFEVSPPGDSAVVAGIACRHVVAQMRAEYRDPKSGAVRRENRYTYDAWLGRDFPGYDEIVASQKLHAAATSYPPLVSGGMEQLAGAAEDAPQLAAQLATLEGFPLRSTITVSVLREGRKAATEVFRLEREVKEFRHAPVADSVFTVAKGISRVTLE